MSSHKNAAAVESRGVLNDRDYHRMSERSCCVAMRWTFSRRLLQPHLRDSRCDNSAAIFCAVGPTLLFGNCQQTPNRQRLLPLRFTFIGTDTRPAERLLRTSIDGFPCSSLLERLRSAPYSETRF